MEPLISVADAAKIAVSAGSAVARKMLQLEDERTKQLKHIRSVVEANLSGPYKAGLERLQIAAKTNNPESAARHLELAEGLFVQAFGNFRDVDHLHAAWAAVHLTIICIASDRKDEALHWAQHAHGHALLAANLISQQLKDQADGRVGRLRLASENAEGVVTVGSTVGIGVGAAAAGITIASGGAALIPFGLAAGSAYVVVKGMGLYRNHKLKAGAANVKEMSAFVNDLMDLRRELGDKEIQQG